MHKLTYSMFPAWVLGDVYYYGVLLGTGVLLWKDEWTNAKESSIYVSRSGGEGACKKLIKKFFNQTFQNLYACFQSVLRFEIDWANKWKDQRCCTEMVWILPSKSYSICLHGWTIIRRDNIRLCSSSGSILGPHEWSSYTIPLGTLLQILTLFFHFFADDSQLLKKSESTVYWWSNVFRKCKLSTVYLPQLNRCFTISCNLILIKENS